MPVTFKRSPLLLIILDGWGYSEQVAGNAIRQAHTPHLDRYWAEWPHTLLDASGEAVGLPPGQMGNSEVGHMNIGAGRIVVQDFDRINQAILRGTFKRNQAFQLAIQHVKRAAPSPLEFETPDSKRQTPRAPVLHLMGLLGPGGVHSHWDHLFALVTLARDSGIERVQLHCFLDGRDTPPQSAAEFLAETEAQLGQIGVGQISTIAGRYYAMDRDNRWDRVAKAYRCLVYGEGPVFPTAQAAIAASYADGVNDEFVIPRLVSPTGAPRPEQLVADGDSVIFYNFRADRAREITRAFVLPDFERFDRGPRLQDLCYVAMTEYEVGLPVTAVAFEADDVRFPLARVLSEYGDGQFHTAETEKYAHVTFFINGGREQPFPGEERKLIPSPKVATYDLQPEMSAPTVADGVVESLRSGKYAWVIVNYANGDMVGHTGIMAAAIQAAETIDQVVGRSVEAALAASGVAMVTADHGNIEQMIDYETGGPFTAHTTNPVPFILIGEPRVRALRAGGRLCDIAPTVLQLMGIPRPDEMTGESLIAAVAGEAETGPPSPPILGGVSGERS